MNPEQDKDGIWFVMLPDGERKPLWAGSEGQWRVAPTYALPKKRVSDL
jgi:hypothetical protein